MLNADLTKARLYHRDMSKRLLLIRCGICCPLLNLRHVGGRSLMWSTGGTGGIPRKKVEVDKYA